MSKLSIHISEQHTRPITILNILQSTQQRTPRTFVAEKKENSGAKFAAHHSLTWLTSKTVQGKLSLEEDYKCNSYEEFKKKAQGLEQVIAYWHNNHDKHGFSLLDGDSSDDFSQDQKEVAHELINTNTDFASRLAKELANKAVYDQAIEHKIPVWQRVVGIGMNMLYFITGMLAIQSGSKDTINSPNIPALAFGTAMVSTALFNIWDIAARRFIGVDYNFAQLNTEIITNNGQIQYAVKNPVKHNDLTVILGLDSTVRVATSLTGPKVDWQGLCAMRDSEKSYISR